MSTNDKRVTSIKVKVRLRAGVVDRLNAATSLLGADDPAGIVPMPLPPPAPQF